jgi:hypothetical protein
MRVLLLILTLLMTSPSHGQEKKVSGPAAAGSAGQQHAPQGSPSRGSPRLLFKLIEHGVASSSVESFTRLFGSSVSMSIVLQGAGYFSANQAVSVLSNFFSSRKPLSFSFSSINEQASAPFATGRYVYIRRGAEESLQIYVALAPRDTSWSISQFNIY